MNLFIEIVCFLLKAALFVIVLVHQYKKYVDFLAIARMRTTYQKDWKHWTEHVVRPLLMVITCGLMIFFLYVFRQPETWINDWNDKRETEEVEGVYEEGDEKEKEIEKPKVEKPEVEAPAVEPPSSNAEENNSFEQENDSLKSVIDELKNELKKVAKKPQPKPKKNKSGRTGYIWKG